jgi:hypothetical protein
MPTLVNPRDESTAPPQPPAPRLDSLHGKSVALLDISKPGGSVLLDRLETILKETYGVATIIREAKPTFAKPAPPEVIDRIRNANIQAVIEALAD